MRIGLLTDGGYPYVTGESRLWCDRLVRGLAQHEFDIYALSRSAQQEDHGWIRLPAQVQRVRTAPLWAPEDDGHTYGRRDRRRFVGHFKELAGAVCGQTDGFAEGLYGLAELARERGGLYAALRSELAVRVLESACRAPGARRGCMPPPFPTTSPSSISWSAACAPSPSTGTARTGSAPSISAMRPPADPRPCQAFWPNASSGFRCWSPSTESNYARTIWRSATAS